MSAELYAVMVLSLIIISALLTVMFLMRNEHERVLTMIMMKQAERDMAWNAERQQLLDRIQAPSFDHLKHAEVRVIRAQKEEKKEPTIELV